MVIALTFNYGNPLVNARLVDKGILSKRLNCNIQQSAWIFICGSAAGIHAFGRQHPRYRRQ